MLDGGTSTSTDTTKWLMCCTQCFRRQMNQKPNAPRRRSYRANDSLNARSADFASFDRYHLCVHNSNCICIGVGFMLGANWNQWQTTNDRRREYRECGEIEFQAVTGTVLISSPGRMEAGMATVIIIQAGPGRCPLVQYLHTGGTIQYPHTRGSGRVGDNYTVRPHSDTCPRRSGSLLVFQSTHSATTIGAVVPASIISAS